MTFSSLPLLAEALTRTTFEWGRIQSNADWILPVVAFVAIMVFVRSMYRRDAQELSPAAGWLLTALRTATFCGLLVLYLQPQWRTEHEVTRNSRVLLLSDTSLSMGLADAESPEAGGTTTRARRVAALLGKTDLLAQLRKTHDLVVLRFDRDLSRVAALAKLPPGQPPSAATQNPSGPSGDATPKAAEDRSAANAGLSAQAGSGQPISWEKALAPAGTETRLGQALRELIHDEQSTPLAGIIVFSDGGQNAGISPDAALQSAREAKIPIFAIGLGSDRQPANVRVSDLTAPPRAYPGDRYSVTGYLQAQKLAGQAVTVELLSRQADDGQRASPAGALHLEATEQVTLGGDGEIVPVRFELLPEQIGRRTLTLRVRAPESDHNPEDNQREVDVEVVDHKNRVLLLSGGPGREYQFLRNMLHRDRSTTLDVLLQTAQPGISQEAHKILEDFPATREEMFAYDCLVALDPDWQALGPAQVDLLEKWVAEQGGGLIVAVGPVLAGKTINSWVQDPAMTKIRALYPVEFQRTTAVLESNAYSSKEPWPLEFSREAMEAEFLWLDDSAPASQRAWAGLPGVYSFFPLRGAKPAATVFARFSDPRTGQAGQQQAYLVGQFYGSGRVFYMGSGEMWRLRQVDEAYFEKFYTKLIRYVSQGRLLRGSSRGVLLVGQDHGYLVGNTVEVRAQLTNAQLEPLDAPGVAMQVVQPDGAALSVTLRPDPTRAGTFAGQFAASQEGTYRLELPIPESDDQRLTRRIQVKVPDLELENPQRNDALLSRIAKSTGGRYYVGADAALTGGAADSLPHQLKDRTKTIILTAAPNPAWEETWLGWSMYTLCALLCLEWLIRRLLKLA